MNTRKNESIICPQSERLATVHCMLDDCHGCKQFSSCDGVIPAGQQARCYWFIVSVALKMSSYYSPGCYS